MSKNKPKQSLQPWQKESLLREKGAKPQSFKEIFLSSPMMVIGACVFACIVVFLASIFIYSQVEVKSYQYNFTITSIETEGDTTTLWYDNHDNAVRIPTSSATDLLVGDYIQIKLKIKTSNHRTTVSEIKVLSSRDTEGPQHPF